MHHHPLHPWEISYLSSLPHMAMEMVKDSPQKLHLVTYLLHKDFFCVLFGYDIFLLYHILPRLFSSLAGIPCCRMFKILCQGEALSMSPAMFSLIFHISMGTRNDLFAWKMTKSAYSIIYHRTYNHCNNLKIKMF